MSNRIQCQNCGSRVELPTGYTRAKIRCPGCGYYAEVPAEMRNPPAAEGPPRTNRTALARLTARTPAPEPAPSPGHDTEDEESYTFAEPPPPPSVPRAVVGRKAKPQPNPRDTRPFFDPDETGGTPLLEGTQEEDDNEVRPYGVPGTGLKKCPHCRCDLPLDSAFCVHCGREITTGAKAVRSFQPINQTWHEGWRPMLRAQIFIALQVVNLLAAVILFANSRTPLDSLGGLISLVLTNLIQVGLQAFLLGSYDTLTVKRSSRGQATLARIRRIAFLPFPPSRLSWKQSTHVGISGSDVGCFPQLLVLYFAINGCFYVMTGVFFSFFTLGLAAIYFATAFGFYWIVLRPSRFIVTLCDVYGSTNEVAFNCQDREVAEEVASTISQATGLHYKPAQ